ncbi:MAG: outer membrane protein transport protein [Gammaproteobacteria bacterium]|nr:outer membrane protein transport protein [Gammaproteobacteria bacterium]MCW8839693.1 outer membrane protein transport protein [Gammaproteobacteria bacterium]MCW8928169.1 outer membrane protein transport protein [Gammaproteobacteria bacterium]MCW8958301.1 outer membrane protein transport protein [Gammaproteobacteria bacterium]MCW8972449.1 outer membrane protein transport protein [Gammaproteobacteria bacterium]
MKQRNVMLKSAIAVALGLGSAAANATNGDQMLGVTATQWGMAGAVTAAPQDAGTVLTNPAGLAVIEMDEFRSDMGFGFLNPPRTANGNKSDSDLYMMPSGAIAFRINNRLTAGMGMAGLSGMGVDFSDVNPTPGSGNQAVVTTKQFYKIAPGFAYQVNDKLSLGAALNIDYQSLAISNPDMQLPQNQVFGFGATFGAIYKINPVLQLGFSYVSEQNMDAFKWNVVSDLDDPTAPPGGVYEMTMDAPAQYSLGLAWTPSDTLLIEADIKQIMFSDVLNKVDLKTPGGTNTMEFGWDDQTVYAIAVQKQVNEKTTVRMGYNYGASPIEAEDVANNIGSLAVTEKHLTLGLTRQLSKKFSGSLSYAKAFENKVEHDVSPAYIELEQNVFNLQLTYKN